MTTKDVLDYFGGIKKTCLTLNIIPATIYAWGERPPKGRQFEAEVLSGGELRVDADLLPTNYNTEA